MSMVCLVNNLDSLQIHRLQRNLLLKNQQQKNLIRTEELQQTNGRNNLKKKIKSPNISSGVLFY